MADILTQKVVKTRKVHRCCMCHEEVPKGQKMHYQVVSDLGDIGSGRWCMPCKELMTILSDIDDGFGTIEAGTISEVIQDYRHYGYQGDTTAEFLEYIKDLKKQGKKV